MEKSGLTFFEAGAQLANGKCDSIKRKDWEIQLAIDKNDINATDWELIVKEED